MEAQIAQMSAQLGIDLGNAIPGAFAGEFAWASFLGRAFFPVLPRPDGTWSRPCVTRSRED